MNFIDKVKDVEEKIIENRRHLHENPELSSQAFETHMRK
jgi:metal-dependent amidase/aminoacylase/carboxypeptidase family protein